MNFRACRVILSVSALAAAVACGSSSTTSTTSPSTSTLTASIAAPHPATPANNAAIANAAQPVTVTATNAVISQSTTATYTFEVATDSGFASKVQTKDGVAQGSGGNTSVALDTLAAGKDYYWHVRATSGGTTGAFSAAFKLTIGPAIVINAPVPIGPLTNATTMARPALRVTNATKIGTTAALTYKFEISTSATFATILNSGTNNEGVNETGFIPTIDLPSSGLLYWRATAIDATDGIQSLPSSVQSFTASVLSQAAAVAAQLGVPLWPGVQPPGATGHATMGTDWTVEPITSFDGVTFINPPIDELQIFDLLDRGMAPADAVNWMHANGYATVGVWYPDVQVIAFPYEYMAYVNGVWSIVIRAGA
jgi:hypothetical protein